MPIQPFQITTPQAALEELRGRIAHTRWLRATPGPAWAYGVPAAYLQEVAAYWQHGFDWRAQEHYMNAFAHYRTIIDGLGVHFVHLPGAGAHPLPLLLLHGWPSTFYELLPLGEALAQPGRVGADPADAYTVVIPSLPGHGYSDPQPPGFADREVARLLVQLMQQLGYAQFGVHAYDLGASIAGLMCLEAPTAVIGYHTTSPGNPPPYLGPETAPLTAAETQFLACKQHWMVEEGGYAHLLGTRPDTVSYALNDSPVGLAAWILEKWYVWTAPPSGQLEAHFARDALLTTITLYWLTQTIASAHRYYRADVQWPGAGETAQPPHGVALPVTPAFERPPREYVARLFPDIRQWIELPRGGHFVALEDPAAVATAIRTFFRPLRAARGTD